MNTLKEDILNAAKATSIPVGSAGQWVIRRFTVDHPKPCLRDGKTGVLPAGIYTMLFRWTMKEVQKVMDGDSEAIGECVMEDTQIELQRHLQFMLSAHGRVLITGLGLGCVVRGTLANPAVQHVTVIERCPDILKLVAPHLPKNRLTVIKANAVNWVKNNRQRFDCAWHDLWSDPDKREMELQRTHLTLLMALRKQVPMQGAWQFPRMFRRSMAPEGVL